MITKPAVGFLTKDSDARLVLNTQAISAALTDNDKYPTPTPTLTVIATALAAFIAAIAAAADGGKRLTALRRARRAELVTLLRQLASYVALTCNNDMPTLISSGFPVQKPTRVKVGPLPQPFTPFTKHGQRSGTIFAGTSPVNGASSYNWRAALASAPTVFVRQIQVTSSRALIDGLTPGERYVVQVSAVGADGPSNYSNGAEIIVI